MPFYPFFVNPYIGDVFSSNKYNRWETPNSSYEDFVSGVTQAYSTGFKFEKFYSDYVTRYFDDRITGGTTGGVYVTGGTANSVDSTLVFTNTSGTSFTVANSPLLFNDAYISGGTLNAVTGVVTFTNTTGGTFGVSGFDGFTSYWSASTGGISNSGLTGNVGIGTTTPNEKLTVVGAISGTTDLYIGDNIRGLRGQFGNLPSAAGANRDLEVKGDSSVYIRIQSTTNANQTIEFMNDQEPDFLIYNKHTDGGLHIASDTKSFLVIGANDADTIDLYGNTIISGNTTLSGNTSYSGTISCTGSVTAIGGLVGEVTGNAATATKIASITNTDIVQLAGSQTLTGTKTLNSFKGTGAVTVTDILDEDNMASNSATALATQQSIKAYVDSASGESDTLQDVTSRGATSNVAITLSNKLIVSGELLDVTGEDPRVRLYADAGDHPGFELYDGTTRKWVIYNDPDDTHNLNIKDDGNDRVSITQTGKVGIGVTGPASLLHVAGTVQVGVDDTGHDVKFFGATSGQYMLWDESADKLIVTGEIEATTFDGALEGNADTATKIASITNSNIVQLAEPQTLINKILTAPTLTTPVLGTPASGNLISCGGYRGDSSLVTVGTVVTGTWGSNRRFAESDTDIAATGGADIVYFGNEGGTIPGAIYYFNGVTWETSDANLLISSTGLTAVALGETNLAGMLIRGMVTLAVSPGGVDGNALYLSEAASKLTTAPPTTSAAIVRVMGYAVDTSDKAIWFNPDNTWVELS